jgi:hypothetical protein
MANKNWIKTSSNENPKYGQSIYLYQSGTVRHATAKAFPMIRLDNGTMESINHFSYWADESIIPVPVSCDTKKTPESNSDKSNPAK